MLSLGPRRPWPLPFPLLLILCPLDTNGARKQEKNIVIGHGGWKLILQESPVTGQGLTTPPAVRLPELFLTAFTSLYQHMPGAFPR